MKLDDRKDIQSVKLAWSIWHSVLKARPLPPLEGNNKGREINTYCCPGI